MRKKRILFFVPDCGLGGGSERSLLEVINNLDRARFKLGLCIVNRDENVLYNKYDFKKIPNDVKIYRILVKYKIRYELFRIPILIYKIAKNYDILVDTITTKPIIDTFCASVIGRKKMIVIVRLHLTSAIRFTNYEFGRKHLKSKILAVVNNNVLRYATGIIAVSNGVKSDLIKNFKVRHNKIRVIYNPVDIRSIKDKCEDSAGEVFANTQYKYIITVARLSYQKNFPMLLKAFSLVRRHFLAKLVIVGEGMLRNYLRYLTEKLSIVEDVIFVGFQENPYKFISKADILVLSSFYEGFGRVLVEAMACGIPVISTDCPSGPAEIISDGVNGLLVPVNNEKKLADSIANLLENKMLRLKLKEGGLKRSGDFNTQEIIKRYEKFFLEI